LVSELRGEIKWSREEKAIGLRLEARRNNDGRGIGKGGRVKPELGLKKGGKWDREWARIYANGEGVFDEITGCTG